MRQIVLDTETTGLETAKGHRIVEIGCVELRERRRTDVVFHRFINPERAIDHGALEVHGITDEFLRNKPPFAEIADELMAFLRGAELVIHNASFDLGFLDHELQRLGRHGRMAEHVTVLDTLTLARERYPGQRNSLDALCKRLGVEASHRKLHGALLDAQLLTDVYLSMTAGQGDLAFAADANAPEVVRRERADVTRRPLVRRAEAEELERHAQRLEAIDRASKGACVWKKLDAAAQTSAPVQPA